MIEYKSTEAGVNFAKADEQYILCVANCYNNKVDKTKEPLTTALFTKYPEANIYKERMNNPTGGKGKPGTLIIKGKLAIILGTMYPGSKEYANDNREFRLKWFREGLNALQKLSPRSIAVRENFSEEFGGDWNQYLYHLNEMNKSIKVVIYPYVIAVPIFNIVKYRTEDQMATDHNDMTEKAPTIKLKLPPRTGASPNISGGVGIGVGVGVGVGVGANLGFGTLSANSRAGVTQVAAITKAEQIPIDNPILQAANRSPNIVANQEIDVSESSDSESAESAISFLGKKGFGNILMIGNKTTATTATTDTAIAVAATTATTNTAITVAPTTGATTAKLPKLPVLPKKITPVVNSPTTPVTTQLATQVGTQVATRIPPKVLPKILPIKISEDEDQDKDIPEDISEDNSKNEEKPVVVTAQSLASKKWLANPDWVDLSNFQITGWDEIINDPILVKTRQAVDAFFRNKEMAKFGDFSPIYPPQHQIFNAFNLCPFKDVRVVLVGQDCYHGANEAMGLAFSVSKNVKIPPSLRNIYKELMTDIPGYVMPTHGNLEAWAAQGILMINSALTVREGQPGSHLAEWQPFTDEIISLISKNKKNIIFILWGAYAKKKLNVIKNVDDHHVILGVHPSPLSASTGFFGSKPFSQTNDYLAAKGMKEIDWQIR